MKWNRLTAGACAALMLCAILPMDIVPEAANMFAASAEENVTEEGFKYEIQNGSAIITEYIGKEPAASIPRFIKDIPVTKIGDNAFKGNKTLVKVVIPEGVKSIGSNSFGSCENLKSITIPDSVTTIEAYAFDQCSQLNGVILPDGLLIIGKGAFSWCTSLTEIEIPAYVDALSTDLFHGCQSLVSVTLPDTLITICDGAFMSCSSLTEIQLPDSVRSIDSYAFMGTGIIELNLPPKIKTISQRMCIGCSLLTKVTIPDSVVGIKEGAFLNCSELKSVTIPGSVKSIGDNAFGYNETYTGNERVKFTIYGLKGSAAETYAAENKITFEELKVAPTETTELPTETKPTGKLTPGDVNGDQTVNILDVIAVNKHLLGAITLTGDGKANADVDGKEGITSEDSLLILKYALEIIDTFQ